MSCLFCRIAAGEVPATVVYKDEQVTAFRDINPQAPTHVLVIPNRHVESVAALGPADADLTVRLLEVANQIARAEGVATSGYRIVTNIGPDAGQSVQHVHVHVLGGRRLSWPPG